MATEQSTKCYAAALGGCAGRRSAEHPISKALLLRLGEMEVEAPWLPGGRRSMTESTLKSRVLCEKHNGVLSPYDAEICKLFDLIAASSRKELKTWHTLNGVTTGARGSRNHRRHRTRVPPATGDVGTTRAILGRTVLVSVEGELAALVACGDP